MTMTSDTSAPAGGRGAGSAAGSVARSVAALLAGLVIAAVVGWWAAGPPWSGAAVVPPACPPVPAASGGTADRLVPMPLPEPRGPVSVRVCGYERSAPGSGFELRRQTVVDPVRTAALAALIDERPGEVAPAARRPAECRPPAAGASVLVFRYTQGPVVQVLVEDGTCGLVATTARAETGRQDVVRRIGEILASG